jgi:cystathionine beta-synthase
VAAAVRYAQNLDPGGVVVVVLPDSGSRYFTRVCDDKWMRENGFLEINWGEVSLQELLETKNQAWPDMRSPGYTDG